MTVETTSTTTSSNKEFKNGTFYRNVVTIKERWVKTSPVFKSCVIGYSAIALSTYVAYNYIDGKNALIDHRLKNKGTSNYDSELKAIKRGINSFDNFFEALFFPSSVVSKIMPSIIMFLHK